MRTFPKNIEELNDKHSFSFPIDSEKLALIQNNIILRNDIAFLLLKSRILNSLKKQNLFENELSNESFLDKKFNNTDRLKIYKAIKNHLPKPVRERKKLLLHSLFQLIVFLLPWIIYAITTSKEDTLKLFSFTYPKYFVFLYVIGILLVRGFNKVFVNYFYTKETIVDIRVLTIRDLIFALKKQNRLVIKENFDTFFKNELENLKY